MSRHHHSSSISRSLSQLTRLPIFLTPASRFSSPLLHLAASNSTTPHSFPASFHAISHVPITDQFLTHSRPPFHMSVSATAAVFLPASLAVSVSLSHSSQPRWSLQQPPCQLLPSAPPPVSPAALLNVEFSSSSIVPAQSQLLQILPHVDLLLLHSSSSLSSPPLLSPAHPCIVSSCGYCSACHHGHGCFNVFTLPSYLQRSASFIPARPSLRLHSVVPSPSSAASSADHVQSRPLPLPSPSMLKPPLSNQHSLLDHLLLLARSRLSATQLV